MYVLVVGGPCTGKTTLVRNLFRALTRMGIATYVIVDWARILIKATNLVGKSMGRVEFETRIVELYLEDWRRAKRLGPRIVLCDGGPIASIAYCRLDGVELPRDVVSKLLDHAREVDLVVATTLVDDYETDDERREDPGKARELHRAIVELHRDLFPGRFLQLDTFDPRRRTEIVLERILEDLRGFR